MTEDEKQTLPENPNIDRAALILFDGKRRERFELSREHWEYGEAQGIDHGPKLNRILNGTAEAIWSAAGIPTEQLGARAANEGWQTAQTVQPAPRGTLMPNGKVLLEEGTVRVIDATGSFDRTYEPGDVMPADQWLLKVGPLPLSLADKMKPETGDDEPFGDAKPQVMPIDRTGPYIDPRQTGAESLDDAVHSRILGTYSPQPDAKPEPVGELLNPNVVRLLAGPVYDPLTDQTYQAGDQMSAEVWLRWAGPLPTATADDAPVGYSEPRKLPTIKIDAYDDEKRRVGSVTIEADGRIFDELPEVNASEAMHIAVHAVAKALHGVTTRSPSEAHALAGATQLDEALSGSTEGIVGSVLADAEAHAGDPLGSEGAQKAPPLFTLDSGHSKAEIYPHGIELHGAYDGHDLMRQAIAIMPFILQQEAARKQHDAASVQYAGHVLREAIIQGEGDDCDAAADLIDELARWLAGSPEDPDHREVGEDLMSGPDAARSWAEADRKRDEAVFKPLREALEADVADIAREVRDEDLTARTAAAVNPAPLLADIKAARDGINAKGFDHEAGDAYLRGEAKKAQATVAIDLGAAEGDQAVFTIVGKNASAMDDACRHAATSGRALVMLTYTHAEGFEAQMVDEVRTAESAFIQARAIAKRHGAAILEYREGDRFVVKSPKSFKIGTMRLFNGGLTFFGKARNKPKT